MGKKNRWLWSLSLALLAWGFIVFQLRNNEGLFNDIKAEMGSFMVDHSLLCSVLLLMAALNWGVESYKWKLWIERFEDIGFGECVVSVLRGLAFSLIIPRAIGEFTGRIYEFKNKYKASTALLINKSASYLVTFLFGLLGLSQLLNEINLPFDSIRIFVGVLFLILLTSWVLRKKVVAWLPDGLLEKFRIGIEKGDVKILNLTLLRYLVFTSQYLIILSVFAENFTVLQLFWGVTVVYFIKSSFITINAIGDLGIREGAALFVFAQLGLCNSTILSAGLLLWVINLLIPSLVGAFLFIFARR